MSWNKSGSRRVPIQHYFEKNWNRKKNHGISSIWSAKCPATNLAAGEYQYSTILKKIGIERKITEYLLFDQQNVLKQIWQPESTNTALFWKKLEPKEKSRNIFYLISKISCNKSGSRTVPVQHYFEKIGTERKITEYLLFDQQKCPATNLAAGEYQYSTIFKKIGIEKKITEYLLFDQQMPCNKSGSRTVPVQHCLEKIGIERKITEYLLFDQQKCPATNLAAGEYQYSTIWKNIGIERKNQWILLFDQQNVLQQIWQPEGTNTAIFWKILEWKVKPANVFYLSIKRPKNFRNISCRSCLPLPDFCPTVFKSNRRYLWIFS